MYGVSPPSYYLVPRFSKQSVACTFTVARRSVFAYVVPKYIKLFLRVCASLLCWDKPIPPLPCPCLAYEEGQYLGKIWAFGCSPSVFIEQDKRVLLSLDILPMVRCPTYPKHGSSLCEKGTSIHGHTYP